MNTLGELAAKLGRPAVYVRGLQDRFELPKEEGASYSEAYLALLRVIVSLRLLGVSVESLRELWHVEKKLLQLLHVDSTGSKTWFLDACDQTHHRSRRLLLTNFDFGIELPNVRALQLGLNFATEMPELFSGREMGEDVQRSFGEVLKLQSRIQAEVKKELLVVRAATKWAAQRFR